MLEPNELQYGADVSHPDLNTGSEVMPLALKAPGKSVGVTGGWRDEGKEQGTSSLKYFSKEKMHQSREISEES